MNQFCAFTRDLTRLRTAKIATGESNHMTQTRNPWTVLAKSTPYENAWIRVDHHEVRDGSGDPGIYGVIHFKNHAIGVVPISR